VKKPPLHPAIAANPGLISWPQIMHHLELYKPALKDSLGKVALFMLPQAVTFVSTEINVIADNALQRARAGADVYLHLHLHDLPDGELAKRGNLQTVTAAVATWSDFDCGGPGGHKPAETLCGSFNDATFVLDRFTNLYKPLQPSLVVRSGYGLYAALRFREPLVVNGAASRDHLERLSRSPPRSRDATWARKKWRS
jgi:hypothetical protein